MIKPEGTDKNTEIKNNALALDLFSADNFKPFNQMIRWPLRFMLSNYLAPEQDT